MDFMDYADKRVVVVGSSSGVGLALSEALVARGAEVIGMSRREPSTTLASFHAVDLSSERSIETVASRVDGRIDAVFNCAGAPPTVPSLELVKINFLGLRLLTERLIELMPLGGAIASISSSNAVGWRSNLSLLSDFLQAESFAEGASWYRDHEAAAGHGYPFSKEALTAWTFSKATELVARGLRINATSPGPIDTPLLEAARQAFPPELLAHSLHPSGRSSTVAEQVPALLFLNSSSATYVNGADLAVDGGFSAALALPQMSASGSATR